jgi:hypothetical protein
MTGTTTLVPVLAGQIAAVNAFDEDAIVATFADDALVNDAHREFWGREAIRRWVARELVGDRVTIEVTEILDHHGDTIVRGRYDGNYDKANLPDELVLTNYFTVRNGKIVTLIVIRNTPPANHRRKHRGPPEHSALAHELPGARVTVVHPARGRQDSDGQQYPQDSGGRVGDRIGRAEA